MITNKVLLGTKYLVEADDNKQSPARDAILVATRQAITTVSPFRDETLLEERE